MLCYDFITLILWFSDIVVLVWVSLLVLGVLLVVYSFECLIFTLLVGCGCGVFDFVSLLFRRLICCVLGFTLTCFGCWFCLWCFDGVSYVCSIRILIWFVLPILCVDWFPMFALCYDVWCYVWFRCCFLICGLTYMVFCCRCCFAL